MWKRILAATDLTAVSRPALETAGRLAKEGDGTLFVLHVDDLPDAAKHWLTPIYQPELADLRRAIDRHGQQVRERLSAEVRAVLGAAKGLAVEPLFRWGRPADTIVSEAARLDAELIVVGARGAPLGSVSERVMTLAGRPVLVVPFARIETAPADAATVAQAA
jgi:nucleotide-binding universal stress UspA family protein